MLVFTIQGVDPTVDNSTAADNVSKSSKSSGILKPKLPIKRLTIVYG